MPPSLPPILKVLNPFFSVFEPGLGVWRGILAKKMVYSIPCGKGELGDRRGRRRTGGFEGTCKEGEDSGQKGGRHRCRLAGQYNSTAILADT